MTYPEQGKAPSALPVAAQRHPHGDALPTVVLGQKLGIPPAALDRLLAESIEQGIVERRGTGWRLTPDAEHRYGPALRALRVEDE